MSEELFSEKVVAGGRTYFIHVKRAQSGSVYLDIGESKRDKDGASKESRIMVFEEHVPKFRASLRRALETVAKEGKGEAQAAGDPAAPARAAREARSTPPQPAAAGRPASPSQRGGKSRSWDRGASEQAARQQ